MSSIEITHCRTGTYCHQRKFILLIFFIYSDTFPFSILSWLQNPTLQSLTGPVQGQNRVFLHRTNLRWRFHKNLWPSQNIWTLKYIVKDVEWHCCKKACIFKDAQWQCCRKSNTPILSGYPTNFAKDAIM